MWPALKRWYSWSNSIFQLFVFCLSCGLLFFCSFSRAKSIKVSDRDVLPNTGNTFKSCPTGDKKSTGTQSSCESQLQQCKPERGRRTAWLLPLLEEITWPVFLVSSLHLRHPEETATVPPQARTSLSSRRKVRVLLFVIILYACHQTVESQGWAGELCCLENLRVFWHSEIPLRGKAGHGFTSFVWLLRHKGSGWNQCMQSRSVPYVLFLFCFARYKNWSDDFGHLFHLRRWEMLTHTVAGCSSPYIMIVVKHYWFFIALKKNKK